MNFDYIFLPIYCIALLLVPIVVILFPLFKKTRIANNKNLDAGNQLILGLATAGILVMLLAVYVMLSPLR